MADIIQVGEELPREEFLKFIAWGRHKARTDLQWFLNHVVKPGDDPFGRKVHGPVFDHLAKFDDVQGHDDVSDYPNCVYTPRNPDPGRVLPDHPRRRILLDPRGWRKTTINVIGHTEQIILNFPDVTIFIVHEKLESAIDLCVEPIKRDFTENPRMRMLFPEFCAGKLKSGRYEVLGNKDEFKCPARKRFTTSATIEAGSATTSTAGHHYHWIKFTDVVTEQNWQNDEMRDKIAKTCAMYQNLLIAPSYFFEYEGTCYHYDDTYNRLIERLQNNELDPKRWHVHVRGCFKKKAPKGEREEFRPEERDWPYALDTEDKRISRWPEVFTLEDLLEEEKLDEYTFRCQKENNPVPGDSAAFPPGMMHWIDAADLNKVNFQFFDLSVDTAEKLTTRADFTALTICGTDDRNRRYIVDAVQDKFLPEETVDWMLKLYRKWKCRVCKIEEASFTRGLEPTLRRKCVEYGIHVNFQWLPRESGESKKQRILIHQPFFKDGTLVFSTGLSTYIKQQLTKQYAMFPSGSRDDLIDTIADHFHDVKWLAPVRRDHFDHERIMAEAHRQRVMGEDLEDRIYGGAPSMSKAAQRARDNVLIATG